ncbi:MAG TPA: DUF1684 domain-containing protein [Thermoanaerobaculia bacterium]|jgi:hypothetical protein
MKRALALSLVLLAACSQPEPKAAAPAPAAPKVSYDQETRDWQTRRATNLKKEDSWLTLVGLFWLAEGENRFGSDRAKNNLVMPANACATCGTLTLEPGGKVTMTPAAPMTIDGKPVTGPVQLIADSQPNGPTVVRLGTMQFQIIERGGRFGIRVKDPESPARKHFQGLEYFPVDPKWRVEAKWEPYNPPKKVPITNVLGMTSEESSPGALVFTVDGQEYRIDPIVEQGSDELFLIFKDATSRDATYPAGRYLYTQIPAAGAKTVTVDFNRAFNPPCAFTDFATCPLPPPQNRLPVRIEAGEKRYKAGHA